MQNNEIKYQVIDTRTKEVVSSYNTLSRALNKIDKLDNAYGGYRYTYKRVEIERLNEKAIARIPSVSNLLSA